MNRSWALAAVLLVPAPVLGMQAAPDTLTLRQVIALAQSQSFAARSAANNREAARWQHQGFRASLLPQVTVSGDVPTFFRHIDQVTQPDGTVRFVGRSQTQSSLALNLQQQLPFTGGQLYFSSSLARFQESDTRFWSSSPAVIGLRQDLFGINKPAWDGRVQGLTENVAERQYLEAMEDIAGQTVTAFFDVFRAETSLQNALGNAAINDTLYRINQGRYQVGKIGEDDLLQSQLALLQARTAAEEARLAYERALATLRLQTGLAPDAALVVMPPDSLPAVTVDADQAVAAALRNASGATSRALRVVQAERAVREAKAASGFGATVTAEMGYNQTADEFGDAYRSLLGQQRFAVGIQLPLVQWGAGKARIETARAAQREAENTNRLEEAQATQNAYFAARELEQLRQQVGLAAKTDTVAARRFDVAKHRYLVGKIDGTILFTAQSEKDAASQAYVQALGAYWAAYYRLRRLTLYDFAADRPLVVSHESR